MYRDRKTDMRTASVIIESHSLFGLLLLFSIYRHMRNMASMSCCVSGLKPLSVPLPHALRAITGKSSVLIPTSVNVRCKPMVSNKNSDNLLIPSLAMSIGGSEESTPKTLVANCTYFDTVVSSRQYSNHLGVMIARPSP